MAPVIRVDDEVMEKLMEKAVGYRLVFPAPNEVIRRILELDSGASVDGEQDAVEIHLPTMHSPRRFALIPVSREDRRFFPGYKISFELVTDAGTLNTRVTSAMKGTPVGDPTGGAYIQGGLRSWFDKHPELQDKARLRIEVVQPGERYKLSVIDSGQK